MLCISMWGVFVVEGVPLRVFLETTCKAINQLPDALERKGVGKPRFDSRSRIAAVLVKAWLKRSHRPRHQTLG